MTQTFNDAVQVLGSQDALQLKVQGAPVQTQPLQAWQTNSGSVLAQVTADGRFQLGTTFSGAADALLQVNYAPSGTQVPSAWHAAGTVVNPGTPLNWVFHELQLAGTVPISTLQNGLYTKLTHNNTGAGTAAVVRAATFQAINLTGSGVAPIGQVTGLRATASNAGTAYLGTAVALEAALTNDIGGSINTAVAFSVVPPVNTGTINALYGLQIPDLTQGAVTNYAVYTGRGAAHLGDNLELQVAPMGTAGNPPTNFVKVYPKLVTGSPHLFAKDASGIEYDLSTGTGTGSVIAGINNGRLTLVPGLPIGDTSFNTAAYFTPYNGNQISLYDGTNWGLYSFSETQITPPNASYTIFDIFCYNNSGTPTFETLNWTQSTGTITGATNANPIVVTSASHGLSVGDLVGITGVVGNTAANGAWIISAVTTNTFTLTSVGGNGAWTSGGTWIKLNASRATALVLQNGVWVKSGATTRRYLGTAVTQFTAGSLADWSGSRGLFNAQNRAQRLLMQNRSDGHTYGTAAWRAFNNTAAYILPFVIGLSDYSILVNYFSDSQVSAAGNIALAGVGLDSTTTTPFNALSSATTTAQRLGGADTVIPTVGFHSLCAMEYASGASTYNDLKFGATLWC